MNMRAGPMIQFNVNDTPNCCFAWVIFPNCSYFTLARTGYIIHSRPMAMGSETVPMRSASIMAGSDPKQISVPPCLMVAWVQFYSFATLKIGPPRVFALGFQKAARMYLKIYPARMLKTLTKATYTTVFFRPKIRHMTRIL